MLTTGGAQKTMPLKQHGDDILMPWIGETQSMGRESVNAVSSALLVTLEQCSCIRCHDALLSRLCQVASRQDMNACHFAQESRDKRLLIVNMLAINVICNLCLFNRFESNECHSQLSTCAHGLPVKSGKGKKHMASTPLHVMTGSMCPNATWIFSF